MDAVAHFHAIGHSLPQFSRDAERQAGGFVIEEDCGAHNIALALRDEPNTLITHQQMQTQVLSVNASLTGSLYVDGSFRAWAPICAMRLSDRSPNGVNDAQFSTLRMKIKR